MSRPVPLAVVMLKVSFFIATVVLTCTWPIVALVGTCIFCAVVRAIWSSRRQFLRGCEASSSRLLLQPPAKADASCTSGVKRACQGYYYNRPQKWTRVAQATINLQVLMLLPNGCMSNTVWEDVVRVRGMQIAMRSKSGQGRDRTSCLGQSRPSGRKSS